MSLQKRLSELEPNQFFKFHSLIRSRLYQLLKKKGKKYLYMDDQNRRHWTGINKTCYIGIDEDKPPSKRLSDNYLRLKLTYLSSLHNHDHFITQHIMRTYSVLVSFEVKTEMVRMAKITNKYWVGGKMMDRYAYLPSLKRRYESYYKIHIK